ncbi:MAG TPA: magnesium transporter CorA family protein [Sphingomicrobium sp.]|nr:magnesium transporter CorA family protein [Sphingomicrobium sp.]
MLRLFGPDCPTAPIDPAMTSAVPKGAIWIDLLNPTQDEEALAEAALGQNIPTREELAEIEPSSRLYERKGALFMTASVVHGIRDDAPDNDAVGFILTDRLLVTVRYVDPKPFVVFTEHLRAEPELGPDAITVLDRLLDTMVDRLADELEETGRQIESVSAQVFERHGRSGRAKRKEARRLESLLLRLGGVQRLLSELRESAVSTGRLLSFLGASRLAVGEDAQRHIESLQGDVKGLLAHADFLADNLAFLLNASLGLINLEQNFVMKIFSVFAVVLMPPTLVAGIYGMNFTHMPELDWLLGYPFALMLILVSAVLPYWLARRSGWL